MIKIKFLTVFALFFTFSEKAHAYPEMVRNGYVNCKTCHVSQNGGGILNEYGRETSRELVATFKSTDEKSKENSALYGALDETPIQKWLKIGGDVKGLYVSRKTATTQYGHFILMQADLEAAATFGKWTFDGTLGIAQPEPGVSSEFIARRHFIQYAFNDEITFRAGKFNPSYGINVPDHMLMTRSWLNLGNYFQSYNLEASYITDKYNFFLTGIFGHNDTPLNKHTGIAAQGSYAPNEHMKIGLDLMVDSITNEKRVITGPFALLGFTPDLMLQTEMDLVFRTPTGSTQSTGFVSTQKLSYVAFDGGWLYLLQEWGNFNIKTSATHMENYGLGLQFFPRTHFELNMTYELMKSSSASPFAKVAYLMTHFYF